MAERAGLSLDDDLDVSAFTTKKPVRKEQTEAIREVAEKANFQSREPASKPPKKAGRRHRTGRNIPLATKVDMETNKLLYQIYDAHQGKENWTLGQIIGFGLKAFQRELNAKS